MRDKVLSLVAAAALLASVGAAYAKGPVTLTDDQLDTVTAGDAASAAATELSTLIAITNWTLGWLNGVPQPLQPPNAMALFATP